MLAMVVLVFLIIMRKKKIKEKMLRSSLSYTVAGGADVGDGGVSVPPLLVAHPCL